MLLGLRVLIVEDVPMMREVLRSMLEMEGARVHEAGTAREAIEISRTHTFDVVLTALGLPDVPGDVVITHFRAPSNGRTAVAVLSGAGEAVSWLAPRAWARTGSSPSQSNGGTRSGLGNGDGAAVRDKVTTRRSGPCSVLQSQPPQLCMFDAAKESRNGEEPRRWRFAVLAGMRRRVPRFADCA